MTNNILFLIGAGIAVVAGLGAGVGIGIATGGTAQAISRQPEASGKIMTVFFLGIALAEATAIYGFVIAILIFSKA
jgi:F-type H+-transporting ATPase subunit c